MREDIGKLVLRLTVALLMLPHGIAKAQDGVDGIAKMLEGYHVPGFVAYGVLVGEIVAPILMIVGKFTRPAAAILAFNMVVAILMAHRGDIFLFADQGGGLKIEVAYFYLFGAIAVALLGSGRYALSRGLGRFD